MADLRAYMAADEATASDVALTSVVVVDGYQVSVTVRAGCLVLVDGVAPHTRTRTVTPIDAARRAPHTVMVLGAGYVTTEAWLWAVEHDVSLVMARTGYYPTAVSTTALYSHSEARRRQAKLAGTSAGIAIFRSLTHQRIVDMAEIAGTLDEGRAAKVKSYLDRLPSMRTTADIGRCQGWAAINYWLAWRDLRLQFAWPAPPYYQEFWSRRSENAAANNRNNAATRPVNALLNLAYKVAETQAALALIGEHLDPAMGLAHSDPKESRRGEERMSGALDLLEVGRGACERYVLALIDERRFARADFRRGPEGVLRVGPPLSHTVARELTERVRPILGSAAKDLADRLKIG